MNQSISTNVIDIPLKPFTCIKDLKAYFSADLNKDQFVAVIGYQPGIYLQEINSGVVTASWYG